MHPQRSPVYSACCWPRPVELSLHDRQCIQDALLQSRGTSDTEDKPGHKLEPQYAPFWNHVIAKNCCLP